MKLAQTDRGRLHRAAYGVYRFPEFPEDEFDPYVLATLWPAKRGGKAVRQLVEQKFRFKIVPASDLPERIS